MDTHDENGATISRKYSKKKTEEEEWITNVNDEWKSSLRSSLGHGHENLKVRRERLINESQETPKFDDIPALDHRGTLFSDQFSYNEELDYAYNSNQVSEFLRPWPRGYSFGDSQSKSS